MFLRNCEGKIKCKCGHLCNQNKQIIIPLSVFKLQVIAYYCIVDTLPHITSCPARKHLTFYISSITRFNHMTHHIFTMTEIILINTGTWKHFLRYMYQKVLPAMFMNITTPPYHLTEFKLCRVRNSARSVESYCTFVTYHIRTLKILFYNLGAVRTPK